MNWIALIALHSTLTFAVVVLIALFRLVLWLALRQRAASGG